MIMMRRSAAVAAVFSLQFCVSSAAHLRDGQGVFALLEPRNYSSAPSGLGGAKGGNTTIIDSKKKARKNRGGRRGYDDVVVLCASYCDDAHPRPASLNSTYRLPPGFQGRNSDGYVWDEYFANLTGPPGRVSTLVNYAYGGAENNNSITPAKVPDLIQQAKAYLHDLSIGSPDAGHPKGKALIAIWIGINPIRDIWSKLLQTLDTDSTIAQVENATTRAQEAVSGSIETLYRVTLNISRSHAYRVLPPDFVLLPLPPAELLLTNQEIATGGGARLKLAIVQLLNDSYNRQLEGVVRRLRRKVHRSQRVFTFDVPKWWKSLYFNPTAHNLTISTKPCLANNTISGPNGTCAGFMMFDDLHPTAAVDQQFARAVAAAIKHSHDDYEDEDG